MTYFSASTGDAASVQAQMRTTIPSHAAWSLVESTTFGLSYPSDVYKCDHTISGLSADFYLVTIYRPNTIYLSIAEGYNPTTHRPMRQVMRATAALQPLQSDGGIVPATQELDWYFASTNPGGGSIDTATSTIYVNAFSPYAIIVAKDAVFLLGGSILAVGGAYDTALGADDPLPIYVGSTVISNSLFATRHPRRGGQSTGYACNLNGGSSSDSGNSLTVRVAECNLGLMFPPGSAASGDGYDSYQPDFGASRVALLNSYAAGSSTLGRYVNGWRRGWARHLRLTATAGFATLDTLTIDGTAYVYCAGLWVEKDPA